MTDTKESVDWREFREFAGVDLSNSFVLSWQLRSETLLVDIDLRLMPEHAFYEKPRPKEKVCIRPAVIEFPYCEAIEVNGTARETTAATAGNIGHGAITSLRRRADGLFELCGEFGTVVIDAERPLLRLKGP